MTEFILEFETELEDDGVYDEADETGTVVGGGALGALVGAAFRGLGAETTEPVAEDVHGWFWEASYRGRCIDCQTVHIDDQAFLYLTFYKPRQMATFVALLTLLDRELKRDPTLRSLCWSKRKGGRCVDIGPSPVDPAAHPDPHAVLASPEAYDLPPTALERLFARLFGRKT